MEATNKPVILFLMMQNPDIVHLVPIAVLLAETKKYTIKILTYQNHVNFQEDERIKYLIEYYGVKVKAISDYYPISSKIPWLLYRWRSYWGIKCKNTKPLMIFGINIKSVIFPKFHIFRISRYFVDNILRLWLGGKKWGVDILHSEMPSAVVIDHAYNTEWISSLVTEVKKRKIPTISFPHSSYMFTHSDIHGSEIKSNLVNDHNEYNFPWDSVIVESKFRVNLLNELGVPYDKMLPIGCVRYTQWWSRKMSRFDSKNTILGSDKRPVVLFLPSGTKISIQDQLNKLYDLMVHYQNKIRFIVKAHARRNYTATFNYLMQNNIQVIGSSHSSASLIDFSDYILVTSSSIINDAIIKNKNILYLKFTTSNLTTIDYYKTLQPVKSIDHLDELFKRIADKDPISKFSQDAADQYMKNCVYGGHENETEMLATCKDVFYRAVSSVSVDEYSRNISQLKGYLMSKL